MPALCRACLHAFDAPAAVRCPACRSPRVTAHPELWDLSIAHMDCDAFYASVEKRDDPSLADRPVIIGGGRRGVVSTACYVARLRGVRSAMPMFQALRLCPDAVVLKGRMSLYVEVSKAIRAMMEEMTPAIEPLSLDEAFLDLSGTARLHGQPPAVMLARLVDRMERELGITGSVGLAPNKFLAKIASDLDKPQGFSIIGRAEAGTFLDPKPVGIIWGIGPSARESLARAGIRTVADLKRWERKALIERFGSQGDRLWHLSRGIDHRGVKPDRAVKSISKETTLHADVADRAVLEAHLWRLAEQVADRAKAKGLAGRTVTLKLKRADFKLATRRHALPEPTQLADRIWREAVALMAAHPDPGPFRLVGCGLSEIGPEAGADRADDLLDPGAAARAKTERATDALRARFGEGIIVKGRALR
ncbi:DNA polymerase IV [Jannaschia sp. Os4]|uniref:DNA polymerase IV n=1 Tax=Jannaschia sp. Os4 TaxID=2807617 RepID=UPI001939A492|nr:DNA polymerase IV [Jannaschia sp. Os4]MBM2574923.1 DNA polymerase IV [Jannaschia sp. Os4]